MTAYNFSHGIEQEIQVVDPHTGILSNKVEDILRNLRGSWGAQITRDYYDSQLEIVTGISDDFEQIKTGLPNLREKAYDVASGCSLGLIASGINPLSESQNNENFGEHHHVGVESANEKVRVHNMLRNFIPELVALTVNSPFYHGELTGFMSTRMFRSQHIKLPPRLSINTYKEWLSSPKSVEARLGKNIRYWDVTPFTSKDESGKPLPTVEVRLFDTQTSVPYSLGIAVLLEAIALKAKKMDKNNLSPPNIDKEILNQNREQAFKFGMGANFTPSVNVENSSDELFLYHGQTTGYVSADTAVKYLISYVAEELDEIDGKKDISPIIQAIKDKKSPAERQIDIVKPGLFKKKNVAYTTRKMMEYTRKCDYGD